MSGFRQIRPIVATSFVVAATFSLPIFAYAQSSDDGGVAFDMTLGQSLVYSDNLDFPDSDGASGLGGLSTIDLSYSNVTRANRLTFDLGTTLEQGGDRAASTQADLSYSRLGPNAQLDLSASYSSRDLDDLTFTVVDTSAPSTPTTVTGGGITITIDPILADVDVTLDNGRRSILGATLGYEVGLQDPVQLAVQLSYRDTHYTDVSDPDLSDNTLSSMNARATFNIDPRIDVFLIASQTRRDVDDTIETTRIQSSYGIGASFDVNQRTTASIDVSYDKIDTNRTTGDTVTDGVALSFGLDMQMPNGTISLEAGSQVGVNGRIDSISASRDVSLRDDTDLGISLGFVRADGGDINPTFGLRYDQDFKRSTATINFTQAIGSNDDDDDVLRTSLSAQYNRPLSDVSSLRLTAAGRDSTVLGNDGEDRRSLSLGATYSAQLTNVASWNFGITARTVDVQEAGVDSGENRLSLDLGYQRALTEDWSLTSGIRFDQINPDSDSQSTATSINLGIERRFSWRP